MNNKEIMKELAAMRNALYNMQVSRDQIFIVGGCIQKLDQLLTEMNKESATMAGDE